VRDEIALLGVGCPVRANSLWIITSDSSWMSDEPILRVVLSQEDRIAKVIMEAERNAKIDFIEALESFGDYLRRDS
jgi:hypothetical protein